MTVILELPPDIEARVAQEAGQQGMPLSDNLISIIHHRNANMTEGLETYLLSESALAEDWLRPEQDKAWRHFRPSQ